MDDREYDSNYVLIFLTADKPDAAGPPSRHDDGPTWAIAVLQEGSSWQAALRALYALEAVVQQGSSASCGEVAVYFQVGCLA